MSLSLLFRKAALCCCLAAAVPTLLLGESGYVTNGGEYKIAGALPGLQDFPHASINPAGGFLVWQDNAIDGHGLGIGAIALDNAFARVQSAFRVNQFTRGDQEHPQVALLKDGGAAFVWQGGRQSFQHIYVRFLSSSNTWLTGDIMVNSSSNKFQVGAAIATLAGGNVVIVYGSHNQASPGSMQDVYGQIFSPGGQKVGSEFLLNEFIPFNQRTPAIAALGNGGFVVAWISEQQRSGTVDNADSMFLYQPANRPSVDVYARVFDPNASPVTGEFFVNTDVNVCANPTIATSDAGFMVGWSQKDSLVREHSWDVFVRPFTLSSAGVVTAGATREVNSFVYGDQFAPHLSVIGAEYLAVWSSMGQDGSWEGVYAAYLHADGSADGPEFRVNTATISRQIHPAVVSDSSSRFLAFWSSMVGGVSSFDLFAQQYSPPNTPPPVAVVAQYAPPAYDPFTNNVSPGDTSDPSGGDSSGNSDPGSNVARGTALAFAPITAPWPSVVITNGFAATKGAYNGLFYNTNAVGASSAGYFSAVITDKGAFTAKLSQGGRTYSFSGRFDATGRSTNGLARSGGTPLIVSLQLDPAGDQIRGHIKGASFAAELLAAHSVYGASSRCPQAGSYTLVIPGNLPGTVSPGGDSIGAVRVDALGNIQWTGTLADGTKVTQKSAISKEGVWPLYASLYNGSGCVLGWVQFANETSSDLGGKVLWIKPLGAVSKTYIGGFTNAVNAAGSSYNSVAAAKALSMSAGQFVLSGAGLAQPITNSVTLASDNKVLMPSGSKYTLKLNATSGLFLGTVLNPQTQQKMTFQGVVQRKGNYGAGFFLNSNLSGEVYLSPAP